jgi:hypothetical protein
MNISNGRFNKLKVVVFILSIMMFGQCAFGQNAFNTGRITTNYGYFRHKIEAINEFPIHEHITSIELTTNLSKNLFVGLTFSNVRFKENTFMKNYFQIGILGMYKIELSKRSSLNTSILLNRSNFYSTQTYPYHKSIFKSYYIGTRNSLEFTPFQKANWIKIELGICFNYLIMKSDNKDLFNYPFLGTTFQITNHR